MIYLMVCWLTFSLWICTAIICSSIDRLGDRLVATVQDIHEKMSEKEDK